MSETDRLWLLYQSGLPTPDDLFPSFRRKLRIDIFCELSIIFLNLKEVANYTACHNMDGCLAKFHI